MSRARFRFTVYNEDVVDDVKDAIEDGIKSSAEIIALDAQQAAEARIREEGAVWKGELLESFKWRAEKRQGKLRILVQNDADHARPLEVGATYVEKGPPVESLIPWVISKLQGWKVENGRLVPDRDPGSGGEEQFDFEPLETTPTEFTGSYDFQNLDQTRQDTITDSLDHVGTRGNLQLLETVRGHTLEDDDAIAYWHHDGPDANNITGGRLVFDEGSFTESKLQSYGNNGVTAGDSLEHIVYHEATHAIHYNHIAEVDRQFMMEWPDWVSDTVILQIENDISVYAATDPFEFVAEVGAMLLADRRDEIPDNLFGLYGKLRGPDLQ